MMTTPSIKGPGASGTSAQTSISPAQKRRRHRARSSSSVSSASSASSSSSSRSSAASAAALPPPAEDAPTLYPPGALLLIKCGAQFWPAIVFRCSKFLKRQVQKLYAQRRAGQMLVSYAGKGEFQLVSPGPDVEEFSPARVPAKPSAAFKQALEQFALPVHERRWGQWSPITGMPPMTLVRAPAPRSTGKCATCAAPIFDHADEGGLCSQCVKQTLCSICGSWQDEDNFLLCSNAGCEKGAHIYCQPFGLDDVKLASLDAPDTAWHCPECASAGVASVVVGMRHHAEHGAQFLFQGAWLARDQVPGLALAAFFQDESKWFSRSLALMNRGGLDVVAEPVEIATRQAVRYRFLNGTLFGVWQVPDFLPVHELEELERDLESALSTEQGLRRATCKPKTVDALQSRKRLKLFFGYRYGYGSGATGEPALHADVDPIEAMPVLSRVAQRVAALVNLSIDQVVVNLYADAGGALGVHVDSKVLFKRPICSLRLFSDSLLSFGVHGIASQETDHFVGIKLRRGTLTVMEGIAADRFNHAIQAKHVSGPTASVLFRQVNADKVRKEHGLGGEDAGGTDAAEQGAAAATAAPLALPAEWTPSRQEVLSVMEMFRGGLSRGAKPQQGAGE